MPEYDEKVRRRKRWKNKGLPAKPSGKLEE
jgi:hypothetical protein